MGTSQSKPSAKGGSPLVPSWADQDPKPISDTDAPDNLSAPDQDSDVGETLEARRNSGMRRSLKRFMATGDTSEARKALGHFSRRSAGGGSAGAGRLARAARIGGGVISALSQASAGQTISSDSFDLRALAGQTVADAINAIVDAFCPAGIVDEDVIRAAVGEALTEALVGPDQFDPASINDHTVLVATKAFVAELVFGAVIAEQGQAAEDVTPQQAISRENELRSLVREVTDTVGTPILQSAGLALTPERVGQLVTTIAQAVYEEMSGW
ncbi:MAG: hypothetical protein ACOH12_07965 [Parvibaculaceae bacterium]